MPTVRKPPVLRIANNNHVVPTPVVARISAVQNGASAKMPSQSSALAAPAGRGSLSLQRKFLAVFIFAMSNVLVTSTFREVADRNPH